MPTSDHIPIHELLFAYFILILHAYLCASDVYFLHSPLSCFFLLFDYLGVHFMLCTSLNPFSFLPSLRIIQDKENHLWTMKFLWRYWSPLKSCIMMHFTCSRNRYGSIKAFKKAKIMLLHFISEWETSCSEQNYVRLHAITWVILVKNSSRVATISQLWICHHHTEMWDITQCSSERGGEIAFAFHFLPLLALLSITLSCHGTSIWQATCGLTARFWRDDLSNNGFACFHLTCRCQALQRGTLKGVVYENMLFCSYNSNSLSWNGTLSQQKHMPARVLC